MILAIVSILVLALYVLTAPFILPKVYNGKTEPLLYKPIIAALERDWFGRGFARWYFYRVCRCDLLLPIEVSKEHSGE